MKRFSNFKILARAVGVIGAVVIVVSGVTFAALQSQQIKLTGNTIETATANLQISADGTTYAPSLAGFDFANLVPGGQPVPQNGYTVFLKNTGATPLALKLAISSTPSNPNGVDTAKVNVILTSLAGGGPQSFSLQSLVAGSATSGVSINTPSILMPGQAVQYVLQASMAIDAVTGSSATVGNIDFAFSGLAV